ncbi:hypothetical protein HOU02_gp354 [Caulobacter phage CcrBL9]|uniref:Uncharacterized protein n=1 Tax=Caulobacter phage CcrBL9 TaxID=2283270 RepID=A0A385EBW1_9CAUD|nr:hypothetical protein HOU02_gp354 [Caulobacter phage CcrBL9]AXQ69371.1 hypothetical protein CcrBL9_gp347 [Caulobacter phage CcrBL9]
MGDTTDDPFGGDEGFLSYVESHSQTERALFSVEHIDRFAKLAGPPWKFDPADYSAKAFLPMPYDHIAGAVKAAWNRHKNKRRPQAVLDPGTYGGSKAFHRLTEDLNKAQDANLNRLISRHLTDLRKGFKDLESLSISTHRRMALLWLREHERTAEETIIPRLHAIGTNVSLYRNLMKACYRDSLRRAAGVKKKF